jgi:small-conductance mechanosensitive channel
MLLLSFPNMEIWGIRLVGVSTENITKVLMTAALIVLALIVRSAIAGAASWILSGRRNEKSRFWTYQATNLLSAALIIFGIVSIWFDDPTRLTTAAGLVTAGLAFALQKVITAVAAYFVILRSSIFTVGDRILISGVRGDVIRLGFVQTTIMEMGQPPGERPDDPNVWVKSRQFTGRIVTVTNDKIFDSPVFNYTREFPYIWEEMNLPIAYRYDWRVAEQILLEAGRKHAVRIDSLDDQALESLQEHFFVERESLEPRVYMRLTDNWIELSLRFITGEHGARMIKDAMAREVMDRLQAAGIGVASTSMEVTFPDEVLLKQV